MPRKFPNRLLVFAGTAALLTACGSVRVSQFDGFAAAGIRYADIVPSVLDEAFEQAVKSDTLVLTETRGALDQGARLDAIETSNANLRQRLAILNDLKRHTGALRAYFITLKAIASRDDDSGLTEAAQNLVNSMGKINRRVSELKVGAVSVNGFLSQAVPIAVTKFQAVALDRELAVRAAIIERELDMQRAAMTAVAESMRADIETRYEATLRDRVVLPYVRDGTLPGDWSNRRMEAIRNRAELGAVNAAKEAAETLRLSFIALVENRLDENGLALLLKDLDRVASLIESVRGKNGGSS